MTGPTDSSLKLYFLKTKLNVPSDSFYLFVPFKLQIHDLTEESSKKRLIFITKEAFFIQYSALSRIVCHFICFSTKFNPISLKLMFSFHYLEEHRSLDATLHEVVPLIHSRIYRYYSG